MQLGKLEKVKDLRSVWPHEANDFTKWSTKAGNSTEKLVEKLLF